MNLGGNLLNQDNSIMIQGIHPKIIYQNHHSKMKGIHHSTTLITIIHHQFPNMIAEIKWNRWETQTWIICQENIDQKLIQCQGWTIPTPEEETIVIKIQSTTQPIMERRQKLLKWNDSILNRNKEVQYLLKLLRQLIVPKIILLKEHLKQKSKSQFIQKSRVMLMLM